MNLAFIGIGNVGFALANNLQKKGHQILVANNDSNSASAKEALAKNPSFSLHKVQEAIEAADVIFLATPFNAYKDILSGLNFNQKILIDCTNPVGAGISHGLNSQISGSETIQNFAQDARVVKCFTIYGYENFENSQYPNHDVLPAMLYCGNDQAAKQTVANLCSDLGFQPVDTGGLDKALHLEHFTLLWVKMARRDKRSPNFVWALLEK